MSAIRYDAEHNRFIIETHGMSAGPVLKLPMRRWMRKLGVWLIPATRANCQAMGATMAGWDWEASARTVMRNKCEASDRKERTWPSWYKWKRKPYEHQKQAAALAYAHDAYAYFMQMGTGKTKPAIDVCCAHALHHRIDLVVVVCPLIVARSWQREIEANATLPSPVIFLSSSFKVPKPEVGQLNWIIVGVESLSQGMLAKKLRQWLPLCKFAMIVDESSRIKNHKAIRTKHVLAMGQHAKVRLILTGTPVTRSLMDLYAQFQFLDPGIIGVGDFYAFRNRYAIMGGYKNKEIVGYDNVDELMGYIRPFIYQVTKDDVLKLPPKVYERRYIQLSPEHRRMYDKLTANELEPYDEVNQRAITMVLERMLRQQQLIGGYLPDPRYPGRYVELPPAKNARLAALAEVIEEAQGPFIIWCRFVPEVEAIAKILEAQGHSVSVLTGSKERKPHRQRAMDNFEGGRAQFCVGTVGSGGIGVTLIAARTVIYYSHSASYEGRVQSEDRSHRIGQNKTVVYVDLIAEHTVDDLNLIPALEAHMDLADYVAGQMRHSDFSAGSARAILAGR